MSSSRRTNERHLLPSQRLPPATLSHRGVSLICTRKAVAERLHRPGKGELSQVKQAGQLISFSGSLSSLARSLARSNNHFSLSEQARQSPIGNTPKRISHEEGEESVWAGSCSRSKGCFRSCDVGQVRVLHIAQVKCVCMCACVCVSVCLSKSSRPGNCVWSAEAQTGERDHHRAFDVKSHDDDDR